MDKQVSLKKVLAAIGGVVLLSGTFFAGMAFENHRIQSELEEAFSGFGEDTDDESFHEEEAAEAMELTPFDEARDVFGYEVKVGKPEEWTLAEACPDGEDEFCNWEDELNGEAGDAEKDHIKVPITLTNTTDEPINASTPLIYDEIQYYTEGELAINWGGQALELGEVVGESSTVMPGDSITEYAYFHAADFDPDKVFINVTLNSDTSTDTFYVGNDDEPLAS